MNTLLLVFVAAVTGQVSWPGFLGAGATGVQNPRPTVKEGLVFHGREPPSQRRHEELIGEQKAAAKSLDRLMGEMVQGGRSDGAPIVQLTATFLGSMREDSEGLLTAALQSQESGLSEHGLQMGILAMAIGVEMGLNAENVRIIGTTAMVCDWGMMRVPQDIRHASRRLTAEEYFEIQKHPMYTADMVMSLSEIPRLVPPVAYQVHERPDGTGYPRGREGNSIHPFARILRVADVYTSLVSPKPFRGPLTPYSAMEFMIRKANKQSVDRDAVRALLNVLTLFPLGSLVQLSDSSVARVLRRNGNRYDSPVVQVIQDTEGHRVAPDNADAIFVPTERNLEIVEALPTPGREELIFEAGMLRPRW